MKCKRKCNACGIRKKLTTHHIFPQRFFGGSGPTVNLCTDCHQDGVEQIIPEKTKLRKTEYILLFLGFMKIKSECYEINHRVVGKLKRLYYEHQKMEAL